MQLLTFTVAGHPYAVESRTVIEVLPLVSARPIPLMPDYVRGVFTYRGKFVPLIDLGRRFVADSGPGSAAPPRLSTRVIVVEFTPPAAVPGQEARPVRLGLIAENVVSIGSATHADATVATMDLAHAPFLGRLFRLGGETIQIILVEHLLPAELLAGLCPVASGAHDA